MTSSIRGCHCFTNYKCLPSGPKKPRTKAPDPGAFAMWMMGSNRSKLSKTLKTEKKPEVIQHGSSCRVM